MSVEFLSPTINNLEDFLALLDIPKACVLNKPIFKKMFLDTADDKKSVLDAKDKKTLKQDVEKIRWLYTLKPSTINIAPYKDSEREYPEIAILHIQLSNPKQQKRIAHFVHRAIPYPVILIFTCMVEAQEHIALALADKRINQADKEKWVTEEAIDTHWMKLSHLSVNETQFLASLTISHLSFDHFYAFYSDIKSRVVALNAAQRSGIYTATTTARADKRLTTLKHIEQLEKEIAELRAALKKETQFPKKLTINIAVKERQDTIAQLEQQL